MKVELYLYCVEKYRIHIIIGLMALALMGIVGLQVFQIRKAIRISEENFRVSVNDALNQVVDRLYSDEIKTNFIRVSRAMKVDYAGPDSTRDSAGNSQMVLELPSKSDYLTPDQTKRILIRDSVAIVTEQETYVTGGDSLFLQNGEQSYVYFSDGGNSSIKDLKLEMTGPRKVVELMSQTLEGLNTLNLNLAEKIDSTQIDELLTDALRNEGIFQVTEFVVKLQKESDILVRKGNAPIKEFEDSYHQVRLFPYSQNENQTTLSVVFPHRNIYANRSVWLQLVGSIIFVSIMLFSFGLAMRMFLRQKKLSEMKNDFINNMTHELKTPIATISLAADALNNPRIISNKESTSRYISIIKEENQRMNRQVERSIAGGKI